MNLEDLRYFAEAARKCNFTQAARALSITPSALSHSIKRLEDQLHGKLFEKSGRNLLLTAEGQTLARRADEVLENIASIRSDFLNGLGAFPTQFRVGVSVPESAGAFIDAWSGLTELSECKLRIATMRSSQVVIAVSKRELELGLCLNALPYPDVRMESIATTESVVVVKKGHALCGMRERQQLKNLPAYRFAATTHLPGVGPCQGHPVFKALDGEQRASLIYDNLSVAAAMLIHCDAWALLPRAVVEREGSELEVICPKQVAKVELSLLQHESSRYGEPMEVLIEALRNRFRNAGWDTLERVH